MHSFTLNLKLHVDMACPAYLWRHFVGCVGRPKAGDRGKDASVTGLGTRGCNRRSFSGHSEVAATGVVVLQYWRSDLLQYGAILYLLSHEKQSWPMMQPAEAAWFRPSWPMITATRCLLRPTKSRMLDNCEGATLLWVGIVLYYESLWQI